MDLHGISMGNCWFDFFCPAPRSAVWTPRRRYGRSPSSAPVRIPATVIERAWNKRFFGYLRIFWDVPNLRTQEMFLVAFERVWKSWETQNVQLLLLVQVLFFYTQLHHFVVVLKVWSQVVSCFNPCPLQGFGASNRFCSSKAVAQTHLPCVGCGPQLLTPWLGGRQWCLLVTNPMNTIVLSIIGQYRLAAIVNGIINQLS